MDMFIPALPELLVEFKSSQVMIQQTLNIFIISGAVAKLIIGPISDKFGRKKVAICGIIIFLLGSYVCVESYTIMQLYTGRLIQAFGSSSALISAFAIVRDKYSGKESAKVYSYLNGAIGFSPIFAPAIGSWLDITFGWRTIFIALGILGCITLLIILFFIKETLNNCQKSNFSYPILVSMRQIVSSGEFIKYTIAAGCGFGYLFTFFSISPYILQGILNVSKSMFGLWFSVMGIASFIGSILCANIVGRLGTEKTVYIGMFLTFSGSAIMLICNLVFGLSIPVFIMPMILIGVGATFAMGAGASGALEKFPEIAGTAASLFCCYQFLIGVLIGTIATCWEVTSSLPLAVPVIVCSLCVIGLFSRQTIWSLINSSHTDCEKFVSD